MASLLPWITLAQIAGILLGDRVAPSRAGLLGLLAGGLASLGPLAWRRPRLRAALAIALAGSSAAWSIAEHRAEAARVAAADSPSLLVEGRLCGRGPSGAGFVLCSAVEVGEGPEPTASLPSRILISVEPQGADERALARVARRERIRMRVRVRALDGPRNPGVRDAARGLARRGIGARAHLVDPGWIVAVETDAIAPVRRSGWSLPSLDPLRSRVARRLIAAGPGGGLLAALSVGDRSGLAEETRSDFARLGIAHLLVVSGLHVALVAGLAFLALRATLSDRLTRRGLADPRRSMAALSLGFALAYGLLAGFGIPLQRALVMATAVVIAFASRREWPPLHVFCLAISAVLVLDAGALFDAGPQLSFAAAGALIHAARSPVGEAAEGRRGRLRRFVGESVQTAAVALAATSPILAAHGLRTGTWGLVLNAIAVPLTGFVLLPLSAVCTLWAAVETTESRADVLALLVAPAGMVLEAVGALSRGMPADPVVAPASGLGLSVAAAMGWVAIRTRSDWRRVVLVVALTFWLRTTPPPRVAPAPPRLVAFEVGQGDALLVQGRTGSLLVDGGRRVPGRVAMGERVVVPGLASLGVTVLDVVVATHADVDHRGGLESVLERIPVGVLWLPAGGRGDPAFSRLRAIARRRAVKIEEVRGVDPVRRIGDLDVTVLWPPGARRSASKNDHSIVLRIDVEGDRVLLTGDAGHAVERALLASGRDLQARVLKVGHHGSDGSSEAGFLAAVAPRIAVVSAGCAARSGLPTEGVLARLGAHGARLAWTGRDGAVFVPLGGARGDRAVRSWGRRRSCPGDPDAPDPPTRRVAPRSTPD